MIEALTGVVIGGLIGLASALLASRHQEKQAARRIRIERLVHHYAALVAGARTMEGIATSPDWTAIQPWEHQSIVDAEASHARLEVEDDPEVGEVREAYSEVRSGFNRIKLQRLTIDQVKGTKEYDEATKELELLTGTVTNGKRTLIDRSKEHLKCLEEPLSFHHALIKG